MEEEKKKNEFGWQLTTQMIKLQESYLKMHARGEISMEESDPFKVE